MATPLYQEIGRRIRRNRENLGWSQEELARCLGYASPATISYFEAGERKISIADLQRIGSVFGLPLSYFLGEEDGDADGPVFLLRATEVRPSARKAVAAFLSFARRHGSHAAQVPPGVATRKPGEAAELILQAASVGDPPIEPQAIAAHLNVPIFEWDFPDEISGIFVEDEGAVCIGVNEAHPRVRQRFTIAHELGHLVFTGSRGIFVDFTQADTVIWDDEKQQALETQANRFAADLLMPRKAIRHDVQKFGADVTFLAKRYGVSEQALWFRILSLKLIKEAGADGESH